jgi:hypothetical protein
MTLLLQGVGRGSSVAGGPPLDGLSPTAAYSFSRKLLSAYGGSFYTTNTGVIDSLKDQAGSAFNLDQATPANRPTPTTAGTNSIACGDFDGSNDFLQGGTALSNLISSSSGFIIASVMIDTVSLNVANAYQNNRIFDDSGEFIGIFARNVSGTTPTFLAYNWDGNADVPTGNTFSLATAYVITWRHESGTVYLTVNGASEQSVASGNTATMTNNLRLGGGSPQPLDGKVFEIATFSTVPTLGQRTAMIQNFGLYVGAAV